MLQYIYLGSLFWIISALVYIRYSRYQEFSDYLGKVHSLLVPSRILVLRDLLAFLKKLVRLVITVIIGPRV